MGKLKLSCTFDSERQDIPEGLKCVALTCKVGIERGGGVSPNTSQDCEDVVDWCWQTAPGLLASDRWSPKRPLLGLKLIQFGRTSSKIIKTSMRVNVYSECEENS